MQVTEVCSNICCHTAFGQQCSSQHCLSIYFNTDTQANICIYRFTIEEYREPYILHSSWFSFGIYIYLICMSYILSDSTLGPVWFTAMKTDGLVYTEPSPGSGPLIFPDNIASLGPGFDPETSIFTAPLPGIYFFTTTLRHNVDDVDFYLLWVSGADANDAAYIRQGILDDATSYNTATVNAIVYLQRGDTINVYVGPGDSLVCLECNFDGYLLRRNM